MADKSRIEWTDATWNPITGCSIVSPGCTNCYAMQLAGTRLRHHPSRAGLTKASKAGPVWTGEVRFNQKWLTEPLRWKRARMIFVCAHGDLFHESVPDAWIDQVFAVMALCPQHTFQVLTKRAERMRKYFDGPYDGDGVCARIADATCMVAPLRNLPVFSPIVEVPLGPRLENGDPEFGWRRMVKVRGWPLPNVWLGVSAERQQEADERVPHLLAMPAAVRFVSLEPLLGPISFRWAKWDKWKGDDGERRNPVDHLDGLRMLDWVIVGGESDPRARPMHPDWARAIRDQCAEAGVPFFFKQWGGWKDGSDFAKDAHIVLNDGRYFACKRSLQELDREVDGLARFKPAMMRRLGKKAGGRMLDDVLHDAMPGEAR